MTNEEKVDVLVSNYYINESDSPEKAQGVRSGAERMAEWKDHQYSEIIKEECNTSYESGLAEGERKAEARFKEYLENEIKSYKNMDEKFFAMEIKLLELVKDELFKQN